MHSLVCTESAHALCTCLNASVPLKREQLATGGAQKKIRPGGVWGPGPPPGWVWGLPARKRSSGLGGFWWPGCHPCGPWPWTTALRRRATGSSCGPPPTSTASSGAPRLQKERRPWKHWETGPIQRSPLRHPEDDSQVVPPTCVGSTSLSPRGEIAFVRRHAPGTIRLGWIALGARVYIEPARLEQERIGWR